MERLPWLRFVERRTLVSQYESLLRHTRPKVRLRKAPFSKKRCRGFLAALAGAENEQSENAAGPNAVDADAIPGQLGHGLVALLISRVCYAGVEQVLQLGWQTAVKLHRCAGDRVAKF